MTWRDVNIETGKGSLHAYGGVALFALALAASTGVLLRFGLYQGMPAWAQNYTAVRHAHSHLMYFGWVTLGLMALIWQRLPGLTGRPLPRGVALQMGASAVLALLSFPAFWLNGYGPTRVGSSELPLGAMVAGLNGLGWFVFVWLYARATWRLPARSVPLQLWDWALVLLLLASAGAGGLAAMPALSAVEATLQPYFLHLFLDLFAVGWFNLALLGLLWTELGRRGCALPRWLPTQSLAIAVTPTFVLGVTPSLVPDGVFWIGALANLAAAFFLAWHGRWLWQYRRALPRLTRFGLIFLAIHGLSALVVLWPGFWAWSVGTQLRIFFLHNLLLGWVSSALLGLWANAWPAQLRRLEGGIYLLWSGGISLMLVALLGLGFGAWTGIAAGSWLRLAAWGSVPVALAAWGAWVMTLLSPATLPLYVVKQLEQR
ncbi:hypothetical protein FKZ61_008435 [Litorilinea aerophila]|uniref:Cbb3-type cytochrome c oxidase subunit I n=1 Tax=Litorilinea aerophila TaxID=1204385 RepID=A0A540VH52_9CHLR|nr:hypothetical protein [Litorilinea aerophila]MCC9076136.1 hypothetical protein [Litorilinea aerophila]OUC06633.1 hypothetical protein RY27_19830 [Litorilinea aerophila]